MNWVDALLLLLLIICGVRGYQIGFLGSFFNLLVSILSLVGTYFLFGQANSFITQTFSIPGYAAPLVTFTALIILFNLLLGFIVKLIWGVINRFLYAITPLYMLDKTLGAGIQVAVGGIIFVTIAVLLLKIPFNKGVKDDIVASYFVSSSLPFTSQIEPQLRNIVGAIPPETLLYLIPKQPQSDESVAMSFPSNVAVTTDFEDERELLELTNQERTARGIKPLLSDDTLIAVARSHSTDMFKRSYFSHVTPDGISPAERMLNGNVDFLMSGENLAFAPTTKLAHQGLMNSPGHRENILRPEFGRIGIGVIDGGIYGKMYTQNFAD